MEIYRKKLLRTMSTLFIFTLCFILYSSPGYAKMSKKKQHKLYAPVMKKYAKRVKKKIKDFDSSTQSYIMSHYKVLYRFIDIDNDGIDECIMAYRDYNKRSKKTSFGAGYNESTTIYTVKKGKIKKVIGNGNWDPYLHDYFIHVFIDSKYIVQGFWSGGEEWHNFYKYSKGKLSKKESYSLRFYPHSRTYYINNKKVSKSKYMKKYNALTKHNKGYIMKVYKN